MSNKKIDVKIDLIADNNIPAFGGFVNHLGEDEAFKIVVNFNSMFRAIVEEPEAFDGMTYKEFFAETVVHEMLHMIQGIFKQAFDEEEVENAIMQCRKDLKK